MKKNYLLETKTCIFLNSYDEREIFLDIFLHQLQKYITNIPIFIIKGSKIYKSRETNLNINVINTNYKSPIDKNFLYDLNWGYRYIDGIKFLKENNYKYVIRFDDDSFDLRMPDNPLRISDPNRDYSKTNKVVGFSVDFGIQNQNMFKNLDLDMSEKKNTAETFKIYAALS
jgi:hypothetical protein